MLDSFIIEQIKRRERAKVPAKGGRARINLPVPRGREIEDEEAEDGESGDRGVVVIDF